MCIRHFVILACLSLPVAAGAQTTTRAAERLDYGAAGLDIPRPLLVNAHTARTAELLAAAYRRSEPLVWKRGQLIADLGQVARAEGAAAVGEAMNDPEAKVRAGGARSAAMIGAAPLLADVEKLLGDRDANVRREAVLAAAKIARAHDRPTAAIERGLADQEPQVIAAALQQAWTPQHAQLVAQKLSSLPPELKATAADALARLKSPEHASAVLALFSGDVVQRAAAVRAAGEMGKHDEKMLADPHPTVRREAVAAMGKVAPAAAKESLAIKMLADADPTVRQAAATVLTPPPSMNAMTAVAGQLDDEYAPLHQAARESLTQPAGAAVRNATIQLAAQMLTHANPRRREDASYILGRVRSPAGIEQHVALLNWEPQSPAKSDWGVIAQAAESLGLIGDSRAAPFLMALVKAAPDATSTLQMPQRHRMGIAMGNAMLSLARLGHTPAIDEAVRILEINPTLCPGAVRASSAFAVGVLCEPGKPPSEVNFFAIYESQDEDRQTKFEAIKALGNLRHAPAAEQLKKIAGLDPNPDLRWIAHWSYERCGGVATPYQPPVESREPPVSISDLAR